MSYRGVVQNGQIILDPRNTLPNGTVVEVRPVESSGQLHSALKDAFGLWQDRDDLGDGAAASLKLRQAVERGDARL